jgi:formylmethanofuran dehydrogenase subunit E
MEDNGAFVVGATPQQVAEWIQRCENCGASEIVATLRATSDDVLICKECWEKLWGHDNERFEDS